MLKVGVTGTMSLFGDQYYRYLLFVQYVENDYLRLVEALEPVISVKGKEEVATCLVRVMQKLEKAQTFLPDIIIAEINKIGTYTYINDTDCLTISTRRSTLDVRSWRLYKSDFDV